MTRDRFRDLFIKAMERAVEFTRQFVTNDLPETPRFLVYLNQSYDQAPDGSSLTAFPGESLPSDEFYGPLTGVEAIDFLWRDQRVPQWIDVSVVDVQENATLIELLCCGRYGAEEEHMYYSKYEMGPFGVKGPALPPGWDAEKREKFNLNWRTRIDMRKGRPVQQRSSS
jgi:hypothetical protein